MTRSVYWSTLPRDSGFTSFVDQLTIDRYKPMTHERSFLFLLILLLSATFSTLQAQEQRPHCAMEAHHEQRMQSSEFSEAYRRRLAARDEMLHSRRSDGPTSCSEPLLIPVAVHFQLTELTLSDCAIEMAQDQVDILNDVFSAQNAGIAQWLEIQQTTFPDIEYGVSCFQFCLATEGHPEGYGLVEGEVAVTLNMTEGDFLPDWTGHLNFVVRDLPGFLGYSPLGGQANGDVIVMDHSAFSRIECGGLIHDDAYGLGNLVLHEVGHYFTLDHPFGQSCELDNDLIDDTPISDQSTYGCPLETFVNCTDTVLYPNFMEYVDDACMWMFTAGQVEVMEAYYFSVLQDALDTTTLSCLPDIEVFCEADFDASGRVDVEDFIIFNSYFGSSCSACPSDFDGSGEVDVDDFLFFCSAYGTDCQSTP